MAKRKTNTWVWVLIVVMVIAAAAGGAWVWLKRKITAAGNLDVTLTGLTAGVDGLGLKIRGTVRVQNPNNAKLKFTRPYLRAFINASQIGTGVASAQEIELPALGSQDFPVELEVGILGLMALSSEIKDLIRGGRATIRVEVWTTVMGQTIKATEQSVPLPAIPGLGFAPTSKSVDVIASNDLDYLFPSAEGDTTNIRPDTTPEQTVAFMREVAESTMWQVERSADYLRMRSANNPRRLLSELFDLCKKYIRYRLDADDTEQVRSPARTWADRLTGVDCDCYAVFISAHLRALGIPHWFRLGAHNMENGWQHVWVVAEIDGIEYALDPVMDGFDQEHPFKHIEDHSA